MHFPTSSFRHRRPASRSGPSSFIPYPFAFTLLEVILALALLALLSGMVFGIVRVSMRTAIDTQQLQQEDDQVSHFIKLCRQTFQNLPATATLTLTITQRGTPVQQELTFAGVPECFSFGPNPISYEDTILAQRPDLSAEANTSNPNSSTTSSTGISLPPAFIGVSRTDLLNSNGTSAAAAIQASADGITAPDEQGRYWMPLLTNVASLSWRFYNTQEDTWEEEWDTATLPELVEMNLLMQGRTYPIRMVYAIPTTKLAAANPALATNGNQVDATGNNTTNGNNNNNNNQGNQPGSNQGNGNNGGRGNQGGGRGDGNGNGGPGGGQGQGQGQGPNGGQGQSPGRGGGNSGGFPARPSGSSSPSSGSR